MQIIRKEGLEPELNQLLKERRLVLMIPSLQDLPLGLQRLPPSTLGFECRYPQIRGRK